jgi:hypothetical protein
LVASFGLVISGGGLTGDVLILPEQVVYS